jgi:hypothetical protein
VDLSLFSQDPLSRERRDEVNALQREFEELRVAESARLSRYKQYREENERSRDVDQSTIQGWSSDYGKRQSRNSDLPPRHNISLPFGMALTVKHAYRIAGRLPDAVVDRREETPQERYRSDTMEKMWWGILHESGGDTLFATGGWDGSQLGATCFEPYFDVKKQVPCIRAIDPAGVLVVRGLDDPHDFQRYYRFWQVPLATARAEYRDLEFDGVAIQVNDLESTHKVGNVPMVTLVQVTDKQRTLRFALGKDRTTPLYENVHGLGFVNFVVIPNIGPYRDIWGWADYEFIRSLAFYIPDLFSREADIIRSVANGAVLDKGTGQDPAQVRKVLAQGGVLPSRKDGSVEPIPTPEIPSFEEAHSQRALEMLKMLGFAPDAAWGGSDTRSGADRALQMQPLVEFTAMKQTNWTAGLTRLASMCFQMIERKQAFTSTYRGSRPGTAPNQRAAFTPFQIGPEVAPQRDSVPGPNGESEMIELPRTPKDLFAGDYSMRFFWQNRIDPDDPGYVTSELNRFAQGTLSLRTLLERLGVQSPEDEMKLIEDEAERFPWLRSGMIALVSAQLRAQGQGDSGGGGAGSGQGEGGGNPDPTQGFSGAMDTFGSKDAASGAMNTDAATAALPGGMGHLYGGA